jgi:IS1 family transposase
MLVKRKQKWVWVGVDRERGKALDCVVGDWSERTGRRLYERLKGYQWRFSAPQTHLWLIKVWFSASTFVVKNATFAKPETVRRKGKQKE